jgi:nicotinamidase-related amidase
VGGGWAAPSGKLAAMTVEIGPQTALIVIDVQREFDDPSHGRRDNPDAEANIGALVAAWQAADRPIVRVAQTEPDSDGGFAPGTPGHAFKPVVAGIEPALDLRKEVHSAFHGSPDLDAWLRERGIEQIAICGIQTNRCCESTARVGCDLGYDVLFVPDAMHTFDKVDANGVTFTAEQLSSATAASLHDYFATVVTTADLTG